MWSYHDTTFKWAGPGKSTICDIRQNADKLVSFAAKKDSTKGSLKRKMMYLTNGAMLDKCISIEEKLYIWFAQKCFQGVPISGPIIMTKSLELNEKISPAWGSNFQS